MLLLDKHDETQTTGWGAFPDGDGATVFRIWAPDSAAVAVVTGGAEHPMKPESDGWHSLSLKGAKAGDIYQFRLADGRLVADPASRAQQGPLEGPSVIVDHETFAWQHPDFRGLPWHEVVLLELHVGAFTPEGTFLAAIEKLPELRELGINAIEIMPVAHFPGERGWGYDGVLQYAPHAAYGTPEDFKALIDAAHGLGMMVFLDVVYNHFGPEGNYLHSYAEPFFRPGPHTPWGAAISFETPAVRQYFLDNASMWIADYRLDGLRFDATEHINDEGEEHFLEELTRTLRQRHPDRFLHLIAEDQLARRSWLSRDEHRQPEVFTATWSDSLHHGLHIVITGEDGGHFAPFKENVWQKVNSAAVRGFLKPCPDNDRKVPANAVVNYLQNHDQVGNRAIGDRLTTMLDERTIDVLTGLLMLLPHTPMLFMGDDYGETEPFCFFADYTGELADGMRKGRVSEAENFGGIPEGKTTADLPDPVSPETFRRSKLDWSHAGTERGRLYRSRLKHLCGLRRRYLAPLLAKEAPVEGDILLNEDRLAAWRWSFPDGTLDIRLNLSGAPATLPDVEGVIIHASTSHEIDGGAVKDLPSPGVVVAVNHRI